MDEPTTGLHMSDIQNLLKLFDTIVECGNTLFVIEHNIDVMKRADWIINVGPDGGNAFKSKNPYRGQSQGFRSIKKK